VEGYTTAIEGVSTFRSFTPLEVIANHCAKSGRKLHIQPPGKFLLDGINYSSRSEAACGILLQRYISDFKVDLGKTFEVPVGFGGGGDLQTVDFRYKDNFLEYHPPRIYSENYHAHYRYTANNRGRRQANKRQARSDYFNNLRRKLTKKYLLNRMKILSNSLVVDSFTLVVATSPTELYHDFLKNHADRSLPNLKRFLADFHDLQSKVTSIVR
jgi:hypothetical protein